MNPKVILIVVAVLVLLFVAGVGLGCSGGGGFSAWMNGLGGAVSSKQALSVDDLESASPASCRQQLQRGTFEIGQGGKCTLTVKESGSFFPRVRTLSLELAAGSTVDVDVNSSDEDRLDFSEELDSSEPRRAFDIDKGGGTLEIRCADSGSASQCRLNVVEED